LLLHEDGLVNIVPHGDIVLGASDELCANEAGVSCWCVGVLNEAVAGGVSHFKGKRENFSVHVLGEGSDEFVDFGCGDRVELAPLFLKVADTFNRLHDKTFDGVDRSFLGLGRNFEVEFGDANGGEL